MADSETRRKAISLGKNLVLELGSEHGCDTLTRWMAHYVGEQIVAAENATGAKKALVEERCFNSVLALWAHRNSLPNGFRPFKGFEPILGVLARLDPDARDPFYLRRLRPRTSDTKQEPDEVEKLLEMALSIDRAARTLIGLCLKSAAQKASTENTRIFLKESLAMGGGDDIQAVRILLYSSERGHGREDVLRSTAIERLEDRLAIFDQVCGIIRKVRPGIVSELNKLRRKQPKPESRSSAGQASQKSERER